MEWKKLKLKEATLNSIKSLTIHGFPNIFRANHVLIKLWWTLLTMCSIGLSIHFIIQTLIEYFSYHVATRVQLRDNIPQINFPVISICNSNKLSTLNSLPYLEHLLTNYTVKDDGSNIEIIKMLKFKEADELFELLNINMDKRILMTKPIKDILVDCKFTNYTCNLKDFEWIFNKKYGNCYRFNSISKPPKIVYENLLYHGLIMTLNLSQPNEINKLEIGKGLYLSIDDRRINVYDDFDDIVFIESGLETSLMMDKSSFYKMHKPYSECEVESEENFDSIYLNQVKKANYSYSKTYCLDFCIQDHILNQCNCTLPKSSIRLPKLKYCTLDINSDEYKCAKENQKKEEFKSKCNIECPLECKKNKFTSYVTTRKFDSDIMRYLNKSNENRNDLIILKIYFGSMTDIEYKELAAMSRYNLLSNIGGTLGIFLGKIELLV
jgi:hypothetical protein